MRGRAARVRAAASASAASGLPAKASQLRRGIVSSQSGRAGSSLAARRSSSRFWQRASSGGSVRNRLPASISFCSCGQFPISGGNASSLLSVRISQRRRGGSAAPGSSRMWLALKPTISRFGHWPSTSGTRVNWLSEANRIRSRCRRAKSVGNACRALPERLRISSVSASSKISGGNSVRPSAKSRRVAPASSPARSCASVCIKMVGKMRQGSPQA